MEGYTEIFKALSDETRLRIVHLLIAAGKELCCCEITDSLEESQYNISRHLKILKNAALIKDRKEGRWVYFNIANRSFCTKATYKHDEI
ncbi:MAG: ArsR/SmtB family transcription factor [bacterium]